jgi:sterol desaturase/sphingolipid hydroxylase (fatty acid hydroxylase superfamily)
VILGLGGLAVQQLSAFVGELDYLALSVVLLTWANLLLGAYLSYRQAGASDDRRSWGGFARYLFPRSVLLHRSAVTDYVFVVLQKLSYPLLIAPALAVLVALGHASASVAEHWFAPPPVSADASFWASLAFSVLGLTLAADFADFWTHRAMHRVWWLWEFHKIHHSAEVMTLGLTARRNHPVEDILRIGSSVLMGGIAFGIFSYVFHVSVEAVVFYGIDAFLVLKLLGFYHLKHSHLHLRFGPLLERIIVSPAQHQLHHSVDPRHYDTNFGTLISLWDMLYGTWRRSEPTGGFRFGLADDEHREYRSIASLYALPFVKIFRSTRGEPALDVETAPQSLDRSITP